MLIWHDEDEIRLLITGPRVRSLRIGKIPHATEQFSHLCCITAVTELGPGHKEPQLLGPRAAPAAAHAPAKSGIRSKEKPRGRYTHGDREQGPRCVTAREPEQSSEDPKGQQK